eukprot:SAG25_NODE_1485_length_2931_cov_1.939619_1_plen_35_part_00
MGISATDSVLIVMYITEMGPRSKPAAASTANLSS